MQSGLVSILLCTYNGERFLKEQIESVLNQTYKELELIIIDDCSIDKTYEICLDYQNQHPNIKLYSNKTNLGINKNFERAVKLADGDYIAFCDQDDIWNLGKIEKLLKLLNRSKDVLVYCNSEMIFENGETTNTVSTDHNVFVKGQCSKQLILYNTVSGHQMLFKKELIEHILPLPDLFWYDWWIAYIATGKFSINYTEEKLVKYRVHDASYVQSNKKNKQNRNQHIEKIIYNLNALYNSPITSNRVLINRLIKGYKSVLKYGISPSLFVHIILNRKKLLYPRIRPTYSLFKKLRNYIKIALAIKHLE